MSDSFDIARAWIAGRLSLAITDEEVRLLSNRQAREEVARLYEGGWELFLADNGFGTCCAAARRWRYHDHYCSARLSRSAGS